MRIKSTVWQWLAAACGCAGFLAGLGVEGTAQTTGVINYNGFTTAFALVLLALMFLRFAVAAEDRERAAKRNGYGRIRREHARNAEYPDQERDA